MQNTAKPIYPGSVASYDTRLGNEMGLFYNALKPIQGSFLAHVVSQVSQMSTAKLLQQSTVMQQLPLYHAAV